MRVPKEIRERIAELKNKEKRDKERRRQEVLRKKKEQKEIEKLRKSKKKELGRLAKAAADWLNEFWNSRDGKAAVERAVYVYGLTLFSTDSFWNQKPCGPSFGVNTYIILNREGSVEYHEKYKWMPPGFIVKLGTVPVVKPETLVAKLHPDFLEAFADHLKTGSVWKTIKAFLNIGF